MIWSITHILKLTSFEWLLKLELFMTLQHLVYLYLSKIVNDIIKSF